MRAFWAEFLSWRDWPGWPDPAGLPDGGGRPVLLVPGFLCGDATLRGLAGFLELCGFRAFGWELGVNWGPTPRLFGGLAARMRALHAAHGPLGVVGVSLGGTMARAATHAAPELVRHLVTVASPAVLPIPTNLGLAVRLCARRWDGSLDLEVLRRPLGVSSTVLWTEDDGVVAPSCCRIEDPLGEVVGLRGSHLVLPVNPAAVRVMVGALAREDAGGGEASS